MLDLFPVPWGDLNLDALGEFLRTADPEPLQWEAKGTEIRPEQITKAAGAFANSFDGGYLILGVTQVRGKARAEQWRLEGSSFADEPGLWVSKVINTGLRPRPAFDVQTFETSDARHVVVVWVPPVDVSPCVVGGTVYERLPGQSIPVKDPQRLADLYGRGRAALETAESAANRRSTRLPRQTLDCADVALLQRGVSGLALPKLGNAVGRGGNQIRVVVGLCPVSVAEDPAARLFTKSFATTMQASMKEIVKRSAPMTSLPSLEQTQTAMSSGTTAAGGISWELHVWRDGSVGVVFEEQDQGGSAAGVRRHLYDSWALADEFARLLGGGEEHFVVFRVTGLTSLSATSQDDLVPNIHRGLTHLPDPDSDAFEHVFRELQRTGGEFAWEVEPEAPPSTSGA